MTEEHLSGINRRLCKVEEWVEGHKKKSKAHTMYMYLIGISLGFLLGRALVGM